MRPSSIDTCILLFPGLLMRNVEMPMYRCACLAAAGDVHEPVPLSQFYK